MLTEQRHVKAGELPEWIRGAMGRLGTAAQRHGGVSGPVFVVYHGAVSEQNDVLAEVCAPIRDGNFARRPTSIRRTRIGDIARASSRSPD